MQLGSVHSGLRILPPPACCPLHICAPPSSPHSTLTRWKPASMSAWHRGCRPAAPAACRAAWACTAACPAKTAAAGAACSWSSPTCARTSPPAEAASSWHKPKRRSAGWLPSTRPAGAPTPRSWACGRRPATGTWKRGALAMPALTPACTCPLAGACRRTRLRHQSHSPPTRQNVLPSPAPCTPHPHCRLEELDDIGREWAALKRAAHQLDARLKASPWRTLCHGARVGSGAG